MWLVQSVDRKRLISIQWIFILPYCMFSVGHVGVYYRVSETKSGGVKLICVHSLRTSPLINFFLGWSSAGLDEWSRLSSYGSIHHLLSECAGINIIKAEFETSDRTAWHKHHPCQWLWLILGGHPPISNCQSYFIQVHSRALQLLSIKPYKQ